MYCIKHLTLTTLILALVLTTILSNTAGAFEDRSSYKLSSAAKEKLRELEHPYLLQSAEGWEEVREKIDNHEWARKIADDLVSLADKFWVPSFDREGSYAFTDDYVFHRNYGTRRGLIKTASFAYILTEEDKYAERLKTFLLRLSDPEHGYPTTGRGSSHGDVKEGHLFEKAAVAYDSIYNSGVLTDAEKSQIEKTFQLFLEDSSERYDETRIGNHQLSLITAAVFTSLVMKDIDYLDRFLSGPGGVMDQAVNGILDDGWYFESDTGYHRMVALMFVRISRAVQPLGIELFEHRFPLKFRTKEGGRNRSGEDYRDYRSFRDLFDCMIRMSDYRGVVFGNNKGSETKIAGEPFELAYYLTEEPAYAWAIQRGERRGPTGREESPTGGRGMHSVLYGLPDLPQVEDPRRSTATAHNAGLYVLRSSGREGREEIQAVLKSGFRHGGREHQDDASLLSLMRYGRSFYNPRLRDSSIVTRRIWLRRSAKHNMVLVNQGNQSGQTGGQNLLFHSGDMFTGAAAETHVKWGGLPVRQRRLVMVTDDYVVVGDHVTVKEQTDKEHKFDWVIHPVGFQGVEAPMMRKLKTTESYAAHGNLRFMKNCTWYDFQAPAKARFDHQFSDGSLKMDIHALWPRQARLIIGDYPHKTGEGQQRSTLGIRDTGSSALFWVAIEPYEDQAVIEKTEINPADNTLRIALKDGRVHEIHIAGFNADNDAPGVTVNMTESKNDKILRTETADETFPPNQFK